MIKLVERYMAVLKTENKIGLFKFKIDNLFSIYFKLISQIICSNKKKGGALEQVIYGCVRGFIGRIPDCKHAMNANCFNEIWKSMIHDLGSRHNGVGNRLDRLKSCCHHSLRDLCVQSDGAWWYCHKKDIGNYPDGCIICLNAFSVGCVSPVKKGNYCRVHSICFDLFFLTFLQFLLTPWSALVLC